MGETLVGLSDAVLNLGAGGIALFVCVSLWKLLKTKNTASDAESTLYSVLNQQIQFQNDQIKELTETLKALKEECEKHRTEDQVEIYQLKEQVQEQSLEIKCLRKLLATSNEVLVTEREISR